MSLRSYLAWSVSAFLALAAVDVALDALNLGHIPIRLHQIIVAIVVVVTIGPLVHRLGLRLGLQLGQLMQPLDLLEHDTDSVVVPLGPDESSRRQA